MKHKTVTVYAFILCCAALLLAIHPMLTSTYASVPLSMVYFCVTVVPMFLMLIVASKYAETSFTLHVLTLCSVLSIGNAAALPLLQYTSGFDHAADYARSISENQAITIFMIPIAWCAVMLLIWSRKQGQLIQNIINAAAVGLSFVYSMLIVLLTDGSSNTTLIRIGSLSFQAAIPALIISIVLHCLMMQSNGKLWIGVLFGSIAVVNASLVIRGETGIPLIFFSASVFYYYLLQPHREKWLNVGIPVVAGLGTVVVMVLHWMRDSFPVGTLLYSLSNKIETRIFAESVDQLKAATRSLQFGGWFGSEGYNVYLMEGSSDLAMVSILHYCGAAFLFVVFAAALPTFFTGAVYITHRKMSSDNTICGISFSVFFVMFWYNLAMDLGLVPILGSQIPFTGASIMYAVLSGFLLGTVCYPHKAVKAVILHLKGDDDQCATQKEAASRFW